MYFAAVPVCPPSSARQHDRFSVRSCMCTVYKKCSRVTMMVADRLCCYRVHIPESACKALAAEAYLVRGPALLPSEAPRFSSTLQHGPYLLVEGSSVRSARCAVPPPRFESRGSIAKVSRAELLARQRTESRRHGTLVLTTVAEGMGLFCLVSAQEGIQR